MEERVLNKKEMMALQKQIKKDMKSKKSFDASFKTYLDFRHILYGFYTFVFEHAEEEDYHKMPLKTDKTLAYYIYHLIRIEDICLHTLILDEEQIFHVDHYQKKLNIEIHTSGNELKKEEVIAFSKSMDIEALKAYVNTVYSKTNKIIPQYSYSELKTKVSDERKKKLLLLESVSEHEDAFWLVGYWCKKDYLGLCEMPFLSHHFLHLWGCIRLLKKLSRLEKHGSIRLEDVTIEL